MFTLRNYQQKLVDDAIASIRNGGVPCIVSATGSGKTVILSELARQALGAGHRVVVVAHRQEIIGQITGSLRRHIDGVRIETVTAGTKARWRSPVTVGMVPTLARRLHHLGALQGCVLLQDECFPAGTLIDGVPIETLRPGDLVQCFDHAAGRVVMRPVVRLFRNPAPDTMARVRLADGTQIDCTPGHPFWVEGVGYVPAALLTPGCSVMRCTTPTPSRVPEPLRDLRSARSANESRPRRGPQAGVGLLRRRVQQGLRGLGFVDHDGGHEQGSRFQSDATAQPDAQRSRAGEGVHITACDGLEAHGARWKRSTADSATASAGFDAGVAHRSGGADRSQQPRRQWLSALLQTGSGMPRAADRCRNPRVQPHITGSPAAGSEKTAETEVVGVAGVELYERGSDGKPCSVCADGFIYNVEIAEHHNYFAAGVLVHNCHHAAATSWLNVTAALQPRARAGLTATPVRPDGRGLGEAAGFTELLIGPHPDELMAAGALCRYRLFAAPRQVSTQGLRKRGGDFVQAEMETRVVEINGQIVPDWLRFNPERLPTITVAVSVDHAHQVAALYVAEGIAAEAVDGDTPKAQRQAIFDRFRKGRTTVLVACAVIDEGLDVPEATVLQVLRPTASLRLWKQLCGRVLRPADGKDHAILLDHTDNWKRLPLPDARIQWELNPELRATAQRRQLELDPVTNEVVVGQVLEVESTGQQLQEITPELIAAAHPTAARRMFNQRFQQELTAVLCGDAVADSLRPWLSRIPLLEQQNLEALGDALRLGRNWAHAQLMLNGLLPGQRLAATKAAQAELRRHS